MIQPSRLLKMEDQNFSILLQHQGGSSSQDGPALCVAEDVPPGSTRHTELVTLPSRLTFSGFAAFVCTEFNLTLRDDSYDAIPLPTNGL